MKRRQTMRWKISRRKRTGSFGNHHGSRPDRRKRSQGRPGKYQTLLPVVLMSLACAVIWFPSGVSAHGTGFRILESPGAVAAQFFYTGGDPMQYAEVTIFSPGNNRLDYQNGWTDKEGRFAFCPEISGIWRMEVNDGMGHAVSADVDVTETKTAGFSGHKAATDTSGKSRLFGASSAAFRVCLGISLVINLFLGLSFIQRRRQR